MIAERLLNVMQNKGITIYAISRLTGIRYELLRRAFRGKRRLTTDELALILKQTDIKFEELSYDPALQKRPNQLMVDVFAEYKRTHNYPK